MKRTLELTLDQARTIFKTADDSLKNLLEANFGKRNLIGHPIGVWCLTKNNEAVKAEDWKECYHPIGVGVITENTAFIVHPEPKTVLPFGSTDVDKYDDIVYDTDTYDNSTVTDCILEAHEGVKGKVWYDNKYSFVGAPAAEYCNKQHGALPTLATAKEIAANIKAINEAMMVIGGSLVGGWLWTSTIKKESHWAFVVLSDYGSVGNARRSHTDNVRAVSAFHFENFNFNF